MELVEELTHFVREGVCVCVRREARPHPGGGPAGPSGGAVIGLEGFPPEQPPPPERTGASEAPPAVETETFS